MAIALSGIVFLGFLVRFLVSLCRWVFPDTHQRLAQPSFLQRIGATLRVHAYLLGVALLGQVLTELLQVLTKLLNNVATSALQGDVPATFTNMLEIRKALAARRDDAPPPHPLD